LTYLKQFLVFALFVFYTVGVVDASQIGPNEVKPGSVLTGEFSQERYLNGFEAPLVSSGDFFLFPSKGLAWRVFEPFESRLIMTSEGITQITHGSIMKVVGTTGLAKLIGGLMYPALSGDWQKLKNNFEVNVEQSAATDTEWTASLRPVNETIGKIIESIELTGGTTTRSLIIFKTNGDRDEIQFKSQEILSVPSKEAINAFSIDGNN